MKEINEGAALNLYGAINAGRMEEAEQTLKANPEFLEGLYGYKKQPMMVDAAETGHTNVMAWLHAHGASFEQVDAVGFTALHAAAYGNQPKVVEYLLDKKVGLEPVCEGGDTPLLTAGRMGHLEVFDLLRAAGANPHATTGPDNGSKDVVMLFLGQLSELPALDPDHDVPDRYKNILWGLCDRLEVTKPRRKPPGFECSQVLPQQRLDFLPEPQVHAAFRPRLMVVESGFCRLGGA